MAKLMDYSTGLPRARSSRFVLYKLKRTAPAAITAILYKVVTIPGFIGLAIYYYSSWTGRPPALGDRATITGFTHPGNNGSHTINMAQPGSFGLILTSQDNETNPGLLSVQVPNQIVSVKNRGRKSNRPPKPSTPNRGVEGFEQDILASWRNFRAHKQAWKQGNGYSYSLDPTSNHTVDKPSWQTFAGANQMLMPNGDYKQRTPFQWFMSANLAGSSAQADLWEYHRTDILHYPLAPAPIAPASYAPPVITDLTLSRDGSGRLQITVTPMLTQEEPIGDWGLINTPAFVMTVSRLPNKGQTKPHGPQYWYGGWQYARAGLGGIPGTFGLAFAKPSFPPPGDTPGNVLIGAYYVVLAVPYYSYLVSPLYAYPGPAFTKTIYNNP